MSLSLTKAAILTGYATALSCKDFETSRLFLVTPTGVISGIPASDEKKDDSNVSVSQTIISSALAVAFKDTSAEEKSLHTDREFILLKDARLETTSPKVNFPVLTVFCDQIIAVTIGTNSTNG